MGELGVVSFGGGGGAVPLHPLERPFTDADGVRVMSQARNSVMFALTRVWREKFVQLAVVGSCVFLSGCKLPCLGCMLPLPLFPLTV